MISRWSLKIQWSNQLHISSSIVIVSHSSNDNVFYTSCLLQQEDICAFPSQEFYEGKLKTGTRAKPSLFHAKSRQTCIVFGHVEGKEKSLVVSTERGNENSKANVEEAEEVVSYKWSRLK